MSSIPQELKTILNRSVWLYLAVALIFIGLVDYKQAAKERSHYLLGIFYNEDLKNFKDGTFYFDYLVHHKPQEASNYFLLGYCYAKMNDFHRAVQYFAQAVRVEPGEHYQKYLDVARVKMLDPHADITFPSEKITIPVD